MRLFKRRIDFYKGNYMGYHDEMDWKETPIYLKLLFFVLIFIIVCGTMISIYMGSHEQPEWMVKTVLLTIAIAFILTDIIGILFDIVKYGQVRKQFKYIGTIFLVAGICILAGVLLSGVIHFGIILVAGLFLIFISIGVGLCIAGERTLKRISLEQSQEDSSNAKYLLRMGKIWLIFTMFILILMIGILCLFYQIGVLQLGNL